MGKVKYLMFGNFLLLLAKFSFWVEDWKQGSVQLFKNYLLVLLMKLTAKLIVNVVHHGLGVKKNFSCRLPKTALNSGFLPFYLTEKTSDLHLVLEEFLKNCVKNQLKKICGIPHTRRSGSSLLVWKFCKWNFNHQQERTLV